MSNKARKKFKKTLLKHFKADSIQEYFLQVDKFYTESVNKKKYIIICDEENPLWVDSTGKGDFFPTVYSLSLYPRLAENYLKITNKLLKKMRKLPMVTWADVKNKEALSEFPQDQIVGLLSEEGELVGVGAMACSSQDDLDDEEPAVYVLQNVQDQMFKHGNMQLEPLDLEKLKAQPEEEDIEEEKEQPAPEKSESESEDDDYFMGNFVKNVKKGNQRGGFNAGANKKEAKKAPKIKVKEDKAPQPTGKKGKKKRRRKNKKGDPFAEKEKPAEQAEEDDIMETKEEQPQKVDHFADEGKGKRGKKGKRRRNKGKNKEGGKGGPPGGQDKKIMDDLIIEAFLNCLVLSVDDKDLPMETPKFWKEHIEPCKTGDIKIKESSFKNLGKFFKMMDKRGLIKFKEAGKKSSSSEIVSIVRHCKELDKWEPTISEAKRGDDDSDDEGGRFGKGKGGRQLRVDCVLEEFCTPSKIFEKYIEMQENESMPYTVFIKKIEKYFKNAKLSKKNKLEINQELANNFGISWEEEDESKIIDDDVDTLGLDADIDEEKPEPGASKKRTSKNIESILMTKDELFEHLDKKLTFGFKVTDNKGRVVKECQGKFEGLTIFAEKQHGKMITRVVGLECFFSDVGRLAEELEKKLSTGFKLKDIMVNKEKSVEISTQGIFLDEIKDFLQLEMKIQEKLILTVNKIDKKKKKETFMGY